MKNKIFLFYSKFFLSLFFYIILFCSINAIAQFKPYSFGSASLSSSNLSSNVQFDNPLFAYSRGFVCLSSTSSHSWYKQFMGTPSQLIPIGGNPFTTAGWIGGAARNTNTGVIYFNNQASPFQIWSLDTNTGAATIVVASCTGIPDFNFTGMVWDHTTNQMIGLSTNLSSSAIFTINMTNGVCTPIGTPSSVCAGGVTLACSPCGSLFVIDIVSDNLYRVNKTTGIFTLVGPLGYNASYGQDGAFDLSDGVFYVTSNNVLRICDTTTGSATTIVGTYPGGPSCLAIVANPYPSIIHTPLTNTQNLSGPYIINAVVTPQGSPITLTKIFWSRNNTTLTDSVLMTNTSGNNWTGNIPGNDSPAVYRYRIKAIDGLGRVGYHPGLTNVNTFNAGEISAINSVNTKNFPTKYSLSQNYPNPFNPVTKIDFDIPKQGFVCLKIYDVLGREIETLINEYIMPGIYSIDFYASDFSSGVYLYKLESNDFTCVKRMIVIK